jgi:hypothetical protein
MNPSLQTRKPLEALTLDDLASFAIWELAGASVRPLERATIPRDVAALSVAADFVAADGTVFVGIVGLSTGDAIQVEGAGLLIKGVYIYAAHGEKTPLRYKTSTASELGKPSADIYPLRFTLRALLEGEAAPRSGTFA